MDTSSKIAGSKAAEGCLVDASRLRRALRVLLDVEAAAPGLAERLAGNPTPPQLVIHAALLEVHGLLAPLRSVIASLDGDETLCQNLLQRLDADPGATPEMLEVTETLWKWVGAISRMLRQEGELPEHDSCRSNSARLSTQEKATNRHLAVLEAFTGQSRLLSRPWRHLLDLTSVCNLRCKTCYQSDNQAFIHADIASARIEGLWSAAPFSEQVNIAGTGEPLLSPSLPVMARSYSEAGALVELTTNGTLLDRLQKAAPWLDSINISFDGASPETFETVRTGARFARIVAGLAELPQSTRAKINLNCVLTHCNVHEAGPLITLARDLQVKSVTFQEFHSYLAWHQDMALSQEDRRYFAKGLAAARATAGENIAVISHIAPASPSPDRENVSSPAEVLRRLGSLVATEGSRTDWQELAGAKDAIVFATLERFLERLGAAARSSLAETDQADQWSTDPTMRIAQLTALLQEQMASSSAQAPTCMAPFNLLYLQSDGNLRPCCVLRTQVGSLNDKPFEMAWNDPAFVRFRHQLHRPAPLHPACRTCTDAPRYGDFLAALELLVAEGLDIRRIARPKGFNPPADLAMHPMVLELGADLGRS